MASRVLGAPRAVPLLIGAILALLAAGVLASISVRDSEAVDLGSRCGTSASLGDLRRAPLPSAQPEGGQRDAWTDPVHDTCIVRVTDHDSAGVPDYLRTDYSRRQAFNSNSTRFIVNGGNGHWYLHDAVSQRQIERIDALRGVTEPQWDRWNPSRIYYLPSRGGMSIRVVDVDTGENWVNVDFTDRLPWPSAAHMWTRGEGSPSIDQRFWAFQVEDANNDILGLAVWDRRTDRISTTNYRSRGIGRPDHVTMSPSGDFVVVAHDNSGGVRAYTRDFSRSFRVNQRDGHSDLARLANGNDAYVGVDYDRDGGPLYFVDLHEALDNTAEGAMAGNRTTLLDLYVNGSATALHISGRGTDKPGWVVVSTYEASGEDQWFHQRVFAVELESNGRFVGLADHHSAVNDYHAEPHATVSRDFQRVLFNSNWGRTNRLDVDTYLIEISPGSF